METLISILLCIRTGYPPAPFQVALALCKVAPMFSQPIAFQFRVEGPVLPGFPKIIIKVYYNDAGAMHSGNHWAWVVDESCFLHCVVAEGYVSRAVVSGDQPFPLQVQEDSCVVAFLKDRYGEDDKATVQVKIRRKR